MEGLIRIVQQNVMLVDRGEKAVEAFDFRVLQYRSFFMLQARSADMWKGHKVFGVVVAAARNDIIKVLQIVPFKNEL